ncbi:helix-turn-helix domain-containing protein [Cyanobacterium aponinum]|uniref:helix-turn-helix domain-containing protein n=1 Tax=Cyanobacterium aponinum TaxID=379064 RepID=UPI000C12A15F|nr:helix-turn-helix domain-containing protein [Cyanobacterium aponinum]PHV63201.1 hypothetical protein CSQ80_06610 [Cyanobacterium aponinum IPPAS B-1201]
MNTLVNSPLKMVSLKNIESFRLDDRARDILKQRLKELNLSVLRLSELTNGELSYGYVNKIIYGQSTVITTEKLLALLKALNLDIENIFEASVVSL